MSRIIAAFVLLAAIAAGVATVANSVHGRVVAGGISNDKGHYWS